MGNTHYPDKAWATPATAWRLVGLLACAMLLVACGGRAKTIRPAAARAALPAAWPAVAPADPGSANAVLMRALSLVGTPYRYGGNTPETGFDCSGLVAYVYRDMLDRALPRRTTDLARLGDGLTAPQIAAGDLVVFGPAGTVNHVGIYVGEGRFVHAPSTGGTVRLDRIDGPYWREHFREGRRLLQ